MVTKMQWSWWWRVGVTDDAAIASVASAAAAAVADVKEHDLTTLLFKTAVNNSSGQESSEFGNEAVTICTETTQKIFSINRKRWKICSVNKKVVIFAFSIIIFFCFKIDINLAKCDKWAIANRLIYGGDLFVVVGALL